MSIIKKIVGKFKKKNNSRLDFSSENQFYESLFVKNVDWNSPNPNNDELNRWVEISSHINFIKGMKFQNFEDVEFRILDLGCGRGWLTNLLSRFGFCLGIEPIEKVVEYAEKLFPNLTFYSGQLSMYSSLLINENINLIVSSEVIEHIEENKRNQYCQEMYDILPNEGFVIITTPRKEIQEEYVKKFGNPNQPLENWMTETEVLKLFIDNGFKNLNHSKVTLPNLGFDFPIYQTWLFQKE